MKSIKIVISILILLLLIVFLSKVTYAINDLEFYNPEDAAVSSEDTDIISDITANLLTYIRYIGIILAAIILSIIGLKYMFGSLEERAEYKKNMIPYIAGCLLLVFATTIPNLIYNTANTTEVGGIDQENRQIETGKINLKNVDDSRLKEMYKSRNIEDYIYKSITIVEIDDRMNVEQARATLSKAEKMIYDECKQRNLLEDGYILKK